MSRFGRAFPVRPHALHGLHLVAAPSPPVSGTTNAGTGTTCAPTLPAGILAGDIVLLWCVSHQPTTPVATGFTWPSGFTEISTTVIKDSSGVTIGRAGLAWKRMSGGETGTVTITRDGDTGTDSVFMANCCSISGCVPTGLPYDSSFAWNAPNASTTGDYPSVTPTQNHAWLNVVGILKGGTTTNFSTPTGWTTVVSNSSASGTTGTMDVDYRSYSGTGSAIDPPNVTLTTDADTAWAAFNILFTPVASFATVTGAASLTGSGTLNAAGAHTSVGAAALTGAGSSTIAGVRTRFGAGALTGAGTLSLSGVRTRTGSATLTGMGTLAAAGTRTRTATAALTGVGMLTATPDTGAKLGAAHLTGTGTFTATGAHSAVAAAALAGTGTLTAAGTKTRLGAIALTGTGTLAAAGRKATSSSATLAGHGTLTAAAQKFTTGQAALTGRGALAALGYRPMSGAASLTGTGALTASGDYFRVSYATLTGAGALTITLTVEYTPLPPVTIRYGSFGFIDHPDRGGIDDTGGGGIDEPTAGAIARGSHG